MTRHSDDESDQSRRAVDPVGELGVRWPDPVAGPWRVTFQREDLSGRYSVVGFRVEPLDPGQPRLLTAQQVRRLRFTELERRARRRELVALRVEGSVAAESGATDALAKSVERARALTADPPRRRSPGRPKRSDDQVEQVARIYEEHLRDGGRAPTKAVAEQLVMARSTAQKWIKDARDRGFLPPLDAAKREQDGDNE